MSITHREAFLFPNFWITAIFWYGRFSTNSFPYLLTFQCPGLSPSRFLFISDHVVDGVPVPDRLSIITSTIPYLKPLILRGCFFSLLSPILTDSIPHLSEIHKLEDIPSWSRSLVLRPTVCYRLPNFGKEKKRRPVCRV